MNHPTYRWYDLQTRAWVMSPRPCSGDWQEQRDAVTTLGFQLLVDLPRLLIACEKSHLERFRKLYVVWR